MVPGMAGTPATGTARLRRPLPEAPVLPRVAVHGPAAAADPPAALAAREPGPVGAAASLTEAAPSAEAVAAVSPAVAAPLGAAGAAAFQGAPGAVASAAATDGLLFKKK